MAFIGNLLTESVDYVRSINLEVQQEVNEEAEAENSDMLRLHLNLSKSLYKNKEKAFGKNSFKVVVVVTLVSSPY